MKALYVISIYDSTGKMQSYGIVASNMTAAVTEARRMAGVSEDTDFQTAQHLHAVDSQV